MQTTSETAARPSAVPHRFYTTSDLLDLVIALREYDPSAASHTLVGLLRLASEGKATPSEQTALRIAGLADLEGGRDVVLSQIALDLLHDFSTGEYEGKARPRRTRHIEEAAPATGMVEEEKPKADIEPVAKLCIGGTNYMIGEMSDINVLVFRLDADNTAEWTQLKNSVEEGWSSVAAEIISLTRDPVFEYIRMHMIHRRNVNAGPDIMLFDLYGYEWFVRMNDEGCAVRIEGMDWTTVDVSGFDPETELGKIAVTALMEAVPDTRESFAEDTQSWARRIAAGASIMPAFTI